VPRCGRRRAGHACPLGGAGVGSRRSSRRPSWFPPDERTTAIAIGSAGQFVGILVAALSGGPVVAAGGVGALLALGAAVSGLLPARRPAGALEWSEARAGADDAATVTALLLLAGNLGGVVLVALVEPLIAAPSPGCSRSRSWGCPGRRSPPSCPPRRPRM
jgi:hypothetical protein